MGNTILSDRRLFQILFPRPDCLPGLMVRTVARCNVLKRSLPGQLGFHIDLL